MHLKYLSLWHCCAVLRKYSWLIFKGGHICVCMSGLVIVHCQSFSFSQHLGLVRIFVNRGQVTWVLQIRVYALDKITYKRQMLYSLLQPITGKQKYRWTGYALFFIIKMEGVPPAPFGPKYSVQAQGELSKSLVAPMCLDANHGPANWANIYLLFLAWMPASFYYVIGTIRFCGKCVYRRGQFRGKFCAKFYY